MHGIEGKGKITKIKVGKGELIVIKIVNKRKKESRIKPRDRPIKL